MWVVYYIHKWGWYILSTKLYRMVYMYMYGIIYNAIFPWNGIASFELGIFCPPQNKKKRRIPEMAVKGPPVNIQKACK